jgi:hypothetical protein
VPEKFCVDGFFVGRQLRLRALERCPCTFNVIGISDNVEFLQLGIASAVLLRAV